MSKLIWQNGPQEVTEVIYDTICGMPIEKALEVLEQYECKRLIPIEWLLEQSRKLPLTSEKGMYIDEILEDWEAEND